jgi:four helix bundle protein
MLAAVLLSCKKVKWIVKDFRSLAVWRKAHVSAIAIYQATRAYPRDELYGLTSQTRRAAVSIPANIAEGCGRATDADFARFLDMAAGSANELEYHLLLACELSFLPPEAHDPLAAGVREVRQMLASLIRRLRGSRPVRNQQDCHEPGHNT